MININKDILLETVRKELEILDAKFYKDCIQKLNSIDKLSSEIPEDNCILKSFELAIIDRDISCYLSFGEVKNDVFFREMKISNKAKYNLIRQTELLIKNTKILNENYYSADTFN